MTQFAEKLDQLGATLSLVAAAPPRSLTKALTNGSERVAAAVGSGGSAVSATFLADCRRALGHPPTLVMTPAEFVLNGDNLRGADVWLFSGSGDNNDILAAFEACATLSAAQIHIVTSRAESPLAAVAEGKASVHIVPTAKAKDGFLATHSLVAAVTGLLLASDEAAPAVPDAKLGQRFVEASEQILSPAHRQAMVRALSMEDGQALFLLHDPRLAAGAVLIETSCWEAALCAVQRVDFRNFAHGRHVWPTQKPESAFVLSLVTTETEPMWRTIDELLPSASPRHAVQTARAGRFGAGLAILEALTIVEAIGAAVHRDPGKPGVSDSGRDMYAADSLRELVGRMPATVRAKRAAVDRFDPSGQADQDLFTAWTQLKRIWEDTPLTGLVLDFDGTIVTVADRFAPVPSDLAGTLGRLLEQGLRLGIATGRGSSAGEFLRDALPSRHHEQITIGYYNGAWVCPLNIDLKAARPPRPPVMTRVLGWLTSQQGFEADRVKDSGVQLTLQTEDVRDLRQLERDLTAAGINGLRLVRTSHTVDICLSDTCKTSVVDAMVKQWGLDPASIMRIGDSGGPTGNDHSLLGSTMGISVGETCARPAAGWPMFDGSLSGPSALRRILNNLAPLGDGRFQFRSGALD